MNRLGRYFLIAFGAVLAVSLLWMLLLAVNMDGRTKFFADGGYDVIIPPHPETGAKASQTIPAQSSGAMFSLFVFTLLAGGAVLVLLRFKGSARPGLRYGCLGALALLLYVEQWQANNHFLDYYSPAQLYADHPVFQKLRAAPGRPRVALLTRAGFYNAWLSLSFPYYDIDSVDIPAASRPPADYVAFFGAVDQVPARKWELCSVRYVLGPKDQGQQLFQSQGVDKLSNVAIEFDSQFGKQALFEYTRALPRASMLHRWETFAEPEKALARLVDPKFDPQTTVVLTLKNEPKLKADPKAPPTTPVEIASFEQTRVVLRAKPRAAGILLFNDRFDPAWSVTVDGFPAEILRANYIMRGIALEPGDHLIAFQYNVPTSSKVITWGVWGMIVIGLIASGLGALGRRRQK